MSGCGRNPKGGIFLAADLPSDPRERDHQLLEIMGSPDNRQIDGMGGSDPLTLGSWNRQEIVSSRL